MLRRGQELSASFASSTEQLPGKRLQLAARHRRAQGDVWQGVRELQDALGRNIGADVRSPRSRTSLQLTLESDRVQQAVAAYVDDIAPRTAGEDGVIGVAVVINGQIQSADVYASSGLFRELFPKLLKAGAVAAVAERQGGKVTVPTTERLQKFLVRCETGDQCQRVQTNGTLALRQETERAILFETCDPARHNAVLHRSYLVK